MTITFTDHEPEYFENKGIRKAFLLSRYADLMRNWITYERMRLRGESPATPNEGIAVYERRDLGKWERQSIELRVSPGYQDRIETFKRYFEREMDTIDDSTLEQELTILETLIAESTANATVATSEEEQTARAQTSGPP